MDRALGNQRTRYRTGLVLGLVLVAALVAAAYIATRPDTDSDFRRLEEMVGEDSGPFHLVEQERIGGVVWKAYAYRDQGGWPCMIELNGANGGCYPYAGMVRGEIGDHRVSGEKYRSIQGERVEYLTVKGTVPRNVRSVVLEWDDGTLERIDTVQVPKFEERFFATLSEGSVKRELVRLRAPWPQELPSV